MSTYFKYFPKVNYSFGDQLSADAFHELSVYADVVDQVRDNVSLYTDYYISQNERPDQVSFKLYDTTDHYWTFFLMNNHIRARGWPISNNAVIELVKKKFPNKAFITDFDITDSYKVGSTLIGTVNGASAKIVKRNVNTGVVCVSDIQGDLSFGGGETIKQGFQVTEDGVTTSIPESQLFNLIDEYNAPIYYKNTSDEIIDINADTTAPDYFEQKLLDIPANSFRYTFLEHYNDGNEELRQIRVIAPQYIEDIASSFREAMRSA